MVDWNAERVGRRILASASESVEHMVMACWDCEPDRKPFECIVSLGICELCGEERLTRATTKYGV